MGERICGREDMRARGYMGERIYGREDIWARGYMGERICGREDMRARGYKSGCMVLKVPLMRSRDDFMFELNDADNCYSRGEKITATQE
jgi:hypothetical protein